MTRRTAVALFASSMVRAAGRLPANRNVKWALGANLWNYFPRVPFTDILDVMKDTGFIGIRVTQFPQILTTYSITVAQMEKEVSKRDLHVITISFNGQTQDPARRAEVLANARKAMEFLKIFGADRLVVFSPSRSAGSGDAAFKAMCEGFNQIGEVAGEMGFRAGLHNHMGQMVQDGAELDRCMAMTDPKLFWLSPDTAHLHLAGIDVPKALEKHKSRLMLADYKDARKVTEKLQDNIFDLGDGEIDFPACHRILKSISFKGWLCVDLDTARNGPRASYERCGAYVVNKLESIYV
ncbi:MAG TPA: TIM barrel protein [Candidatus Acidoferrales bacterium]|nr:TIM barrel protein [Candidatus Acidoferrales bacterium]